MYTKLLLAVLLVAANCTAQTDPVLDAYLASHRYTINLEKDSSTSFADSRLPAMLERAMKGRQLFVYGESLSHDLELHNDLERMFVRHFAAHGLRYYFIEWPRSWVVDVNMHIAPDIQLAPAYWRYAFHPNHYYHQERLLRTAAPNVEYAATDFERRSSFHYALQIISSTVDKGNLQRLQELAPYMRDSSYLSLSRGKFVKFYKVQRDRFFADSNSYKAVLGNTYAHFRYLMSDPLPSSYNNNRNANMAKHVLMQIGDAPAGEMYMLSIGNGHLMYRDGVSKTTMGILRDSRQLENKIIVTGLYCEDCLVNGKPGVGENNGMKYIGGAVLESFRKAANSNIVLFDLTELPPQFRYLTAKSDLLIFAKGMR